MARDPALQPFDKLSTWNRPLGANAIYTPIQSATGGGFWTGTLNTSDWTMSIWVASFSDPIRRIKITNRGPDFFVDRHVPDAAVPSAGEDGHLNIISPDHTTAVELFQAVRQADMSIVAAGGGVDVDLRGSGIEIFGPAGGFAMADGSSSCGGVIRKGEFVSGIKHALQFFTNPYSWNKFAPGGRPYVYHASSADGYWPNTTGDPQYGTTGNLFMGSLVAIPPSVNINAIGIVRPEALEVAKALQNYGAYGVDSGSGQGRIVFRYDWAARLAGDIDGLLADFATFHADLDRIATYLQVVTNSHANGQKPTLGPTEGTGGGAPRVALLEDFDAGPLTDDPTNLQVTGVTSTSISISVQDNKTDEQAYDVEIRAFGTSSWTVIPDAIAGTGGTGTRTYTIPNLTPGTTYEIRVRGYKLTASTTLSTDEFDRADSSTLGSTSQGHTWTEFKGDLEILTNQVRKTGGTGGADAAARAEVDLTADHYAEVDVRIPSGAGADSRAGVLVRKAVNTEDTFYFGELLYSGGALSFRLVRRVSTADTVLWSEFFGALDTTYKIRVEAQGTTIRFFRDGVLKATVTNMAIASNQRAGIYANVSGRVVGGYKAESLSDGGGAPVRTDTAYTVIVQGTTTFQVPSAPTGFLIDGSPDISSIPTSWVHDPAAHGTTSYEIEYRNVTLSEAFTGTPQVTGIPAGTSTTHTKVVTGLASATQWELRVRARNNAGAGGWSNLQTATTTTSPQPPAQPTNHVLEVLSHDKLRSTITDNAGDEVDSVWDLDREATVGAGLPGTYAYATSTLSPNVTLKDFTDPSPGNGGLRYKARWKMRNANGSSAYAFSNEIVTPNLVPSPPGGGAYVLTWSATRSYGESSVERLSPLDRTSPNFGR